jgi:spore germination protein YaaH
MKYLSALALLVVGMLTSSVSATTGGSSSPAPGPDGSHPTVMQRAADEMATATPNSVVPSAPPVQPAATAANGTQREVFGFALASSLGDLSVGYPTWNFSLLSTVAFFGLHINDDGTIAADSGWTVWNSSQLTNLLSTAHSSGTKVVVTIIEQDFGAGTPHMCAALSNRATTIAQTVAQVAAKGVDGVNIDYEGLSGTCPNRQTARGMMTDFAHGLRGALPSGSYLSVDTYAGSAADPAGFFDIAGLKAYVDSFFVMAYDLEYSNYAHAPASCTSLCLGPTAPLAGYFYNDTASASQYISAVGASKVILGVPYYGRKSCVATAGPNQYPSSAVAADPYLTASVESSAPQVQAGSYSVQRDANDPAGHERWDTWVNTNLNCTRELYWDDTVSLGLKYDLVNKDALRGVGIWNLNYGGGAPELWTDLYDHFAACKSAGVVAVPTSPQQRGAQVHVTATASGCSNPQYEFWLQNPSGTWVMKQAFSSSGTWSWDTGVYPIGQYTVHVWATQVGGDMSTWQAFGEAAYSLTPPVPCATASLTPSLTPSNPSQPAGSSVAFTASSTGCGTPLYEYWVKLLNGSWYMRRGFSTDPAWSWDTSGLAQATYTVHVWAKQAGDSTSSWEAYGSSTVTLTGCALATLSPATGSSKVGTPVQFAAGSSTCQNPVYEFWIQTPAGRWYLMQPFSTSPNWTWTNETGWPKGVYHIHVWANNQGADYSSWESYASATFSLT